MSIPANRASSVTHQNCPGCQSWIAVETVRCPVCRRVLRPEQSPPSTLQSFDTATPWGFDGPCPYCAIDIILVAWGDHCPVCWNVPAQADMKHHRSTPATPNGRPSELPLTTAGSEPTGFGEGLVQVTPTLMRQEPPDGDPLQSLAALLLLLELLVVAWLIAPLIFVVLLLFFLISVVLGPPAAGSTLVREAIALPYLTLRLVFGNQADSSLFGGIFGQQSVWSYQLELRQGTASNFVLKGRLAPQPIEVGHYVRVWVAPIQGEPRLRYGLLRDPASGAWIRLRRADVAVGVYWLIGVLVLTAGSLILNVVF